MSYRDYTSKENEKAVLNDFNPRILQVGFEHNSPGWYNLQHSHKCCELILLLEGKESIVINGESRYEVEANDLVILNADVAHQEFSYSNLIREAIVCTFDNFKLSDFPENHLINKNSNPIFRDLDNNSKMVDLFYKLLDESKSDNYYSYSMVSAYLKQILIEILRKKGSNKNLSKSNVMECEVAKNYIDEHYGEKINLDDLANMVYVSKGHFSHLFKTQIGEAPIRYLINKRLEVAKDLLVNTDDSINNIALKVGYDNQAYFSQFFIKETGMSPNKYRKLKRLL